MFDELFKQAQRLFSSKKNAGKLVRKSTDRMHGFKLTILSLSIIFLIGYSQFRAHFDCYKSEDYDKKYIINFCWINGTTTTNVRTDNSDESKILSFNSRPRQDGAGSDGIIFKSALHKIIPHIGLQFAQGDRYEVINHNYMRSVWAMLILMAICSFVAQRKWRTLFEDDILKALLQLPGHSNLNLVKSAQKAQPYSTLVRIAEAKSTGACPSSTGGSERSTDLDGAGQHRQSKYSSQSSSSRPATVFYEADGGPNDDRVRQTSTDDPAATFKTVIKIHQHSLLASGLDIISSVGDKNEHNHLLDYYTNQLVYLLLANCLHYKRSLASLNLRKRLLVYSVWSTLMTAMQFILPWLFIGNRYNWYGWDYSKAWLHYVWNLIRLSLYPTTTGESISDVGNVIFGEDGQPIAQPTQSHMIPNTIDYELSSKIWPTSTQCEYKQYGYQGIETVVLQCTVPINEICAKLFAVIWWFVAINFVVELYCLLFLLMSFVDKNIVRCLFGVRFWPGARKEADNIATFLYKQSRLFVNDYTDANRKSGPDDEFYPSFARKNSTNCEYNSKTFEAQREHFRNDYSQNRYRTAGRGASGWFQGAYRSLMRCRICSNRDDSEFRAPGTGEPIDTSIYYILYFIYMRLGNSRKKVRQVIQMTSHALSLYLSNLNNTLDMINNSSNTTTSFSDKSTGDLAPNGGKADEMQIQSFEICTINRQSSRPDDQ